MSSTALDTSIERLSKLLHCKTKEINDVYKLYPSILELPNGLVVSRAERLINFFSCSVENIYEMYKRYLPTMLYMPSEIETILRYKHNKTAAIKRAILEYPWILACISKHKNHEYCGFQSLEQFIIVAKLISRQFGEVISVFKRRWNSNNNDITYLLTRIEDEYYLLCLGAFVDDEFDDPMINHHTITYQRIPKNSICDLEQFVIYSYECFNRGQKGYTLENGMVLIEISFYKIYNDHNFEAEYEIDSKNIIKIKGIILLNENYSKRHCEYYSQIDNYMNAWIDSIFTSKKLDEEYIRTLEKKIKGLEERNNYINAIFGSNEEMMKFIYKE